MDLDAIEAAEKAMTRWPWSYGECGGDQWIEHLGEESVATFEDIIESEENLKGITLLRNAAPAMIARIREQDAVIAELRALCGEADHLIGLLDYYNSYHPDRMKFRAASKGEQ